MRWYSPLECAATKTATEPLSLGVSFLPAECGTWKSYPRKEWGGSFYRVLESSPVYHNHFFFPAFP